MKNFVFPDYHRDC